MTAPWAKALALLLRGTSTPAFLTVVARDADRGIGRDQGPADTAGRSTAVSSATRPATARSTAAGDVMAARIRGGPRVAGGIARGTATGREPDEPHHGDRTDASDFPSQGSHVPRSPYGIRRPVEQALCRLPGTAWHRFLAEPLLDLLGHRFDREAELFLDVLVRRRHAEVVAPDDEPVVARPRRATDR